MSDIATTDVSVEAGEAAESTGLDVDASTLDSEQSTPETADSQESVAEYLFEVEGEKITLEEARNGFLRNADYTRKTQEVAAERKRLAQAEAIATALETNPAATLQALAEVAGLKAAFDQGPDPMEDLDPSDRRLAEVEAELARMHEAQRQEQIDVELSQLHDQHGEFDDAELFAHAIKGGFPSLNAAYRDLHFDALQAKAAAAEAAKQAEAERVGAKKAQAATVHTAGVAGAGPAEAKQFGSIREAFLAAKQAHLGQ
jgi:hypothetical protein